MANEMRGEVEIQLGDRKLTLKFNMNTIRLMLKSSGRKLSEIGEWFTDDHLDVMTHAVYAAILNAAILSGKKWDRDFEETAALIGDWMMDQDELERVSEAMAFALNGGKPMAPETAEAPAKTESA